MIRAQLLSAATVATLLAACASTSPSTTYVRDTATVPSGSTTYYSGGSAGTAGTVSGGASASS
jgi:uncharacterized lipoprotein YmbA